MNTFIVVVLMMCGSPKGYTVLDINAGTSTEYSYTGMLQAIVKHEPERLMVVKVNSVGRCA